MSSWPVGRLFAACLLCAGLSGFTAAQNPAFSWEQIAGQLLLRPNYPLVDVTARSFEQIRYADQFCATPGTYDQTCLTGAASSWTGMIVISKHVYTIGSSISVTNPLRVDPGASFSVSAAQTLTILGPLDAGRYQIFAGAGTVAFSSGSVFDYQVPALDPEWWGAIPDGSTDSTSALQATMTAAESAYTYVSLAPGIYLTGNLQAGNPSTKATVGQSTQAPGVKGIIGATRAWSILRAKTGTTGYLLTRNNLASADFERFEIDGNSIAKGADFSWLAGSPSTQNIFRDLRVINTPGEGFDFDNDNDAVISGISADAIAHSDIAISAQGVSGQMSLVDVIVYTGTLDISAQSFECVNCTALDGVVIPGQGYNVGAFQSGQIWANVTSGIAFNVTSAGAPGTYGLVFDGTYFGAATGQFVFGGNFGSGITCHECLVPATAGTLFGTITGSFGGSVPVFYFDHSISNATYAANPAAYLMQADDTYIGGTLQNITATPHTFTGALTLPNTYTVGANVITQPSAAGTLALAGANGLSSGTVALAAGAGSHTFAVAYTSVPNCVAVDTTAAAAVKATSSTTAVTFAGTGTDVIAWQCAPSAN